MYSSPTRQLRSREGSKKRVIERWQTGAATPACRTSTLTPTKEIIMMAIATIQAHEHAPKTEISNPQIWTPIWQGKPLHAFSFSLPSQLFELNSFNFPYLLASKLAALGTEHEIKNELCRTGLLSPSSALPASIVAGPDRFLIANPIFVCAGRIVPNLPTPGLTGTPKYDLQGLVADLRKSLVALNCITGGRDV